MRKTLTLLAACFTATAFSNIIYVNDDASGGADGTNWNDAYTDLGLAISLSNTSDTIVVASGVYKPDGSDRTKSFRMEPDRVLLGGFDGTETSFDQQTLDNRDFVSNASVLSGDLNDDDDFPHVNMIDNSFHVVLYDGAFSYDANAVLDGFSIQSGNANGTSIDKTNYGGGIYFDGEGHSGVMAPTLTNLNIINNRANFGAGMAITAWNGTTGFIEVNPSITKSVFEGNHADSTTTNSSYAICGGGAIYIYGGRESSSKPIFDDVEFFNNKAELPGFSVSEYGGAVHLFSSSEGIVNPTFMNTFFCGNEATYGGTIHSWSGSDGSTPSTGVVDVVLINTTIRSDMANFPIHNDFRLDLTNGKSHYSLTNTIIETSALKGITHINGGTADVSYSLLKGSGASGAGWDVNCGTDGGNNVEGDPQFVSSSCDATLHAASSCVGSGNITYGNNIGYYQGVGVQPLELSTTENQMSCYGSSLNDIQIIFKDEELSTVQFDVFSSLESFVPNSGIVSNVSGDTLSIQITPNDTAAITTLTIQAVNSQNDTVTTAFDFEIIYFRIDSISTWVPSDTTHCVKLETPYGWVIENVWYQGATDTVQNFNTICGLIGGNYLVFGSQNGCRDSIEVALDTVVANITLAIAPLPWDSLCAGQEQVYLLDVTNESMENVFFDGIYGNGGQNDSAYLVERNDSIWLHFVMAPTAYWHQGTVYISDERGDYVGLEYNFFTLVPAEIDSVYADDNYWHYVAYTGGDGGVIKYRLDSTDEFDYLANFPNWDVPLGVTHHLHLETSRDGFTCMSDVYSFTLASTGIEDYSNPFNIVIFPNPSDGNVQLMNLPKGEAVLLLMDLQGKEVLSVDLDQDNIRLDQMEPGSYLTKIIKAGRGIYTGKLIIE